MIKKLCIRLVLDNQHTKVKTLIINFTFSKLIKPFSVSQSLTLDCPMFVRLWKLAILEIFKISNRSIWGRRFQKISEKSKNLCHFLIGQQ
jgi:hypothetical protein